MISLLVLTFAVFIADELVLHQLSEDLVAAAMLQTGYGRHQIDRDNLVVLHAHLHLHTQSDELTLTAARERTGVLTAVRTLKSSLERYLNNATFSFPMASPIFCISIDVHVLFDRHYLECGGRGLLIDHAP